MRVITDRVTAYIELTDDIVVEEDKGWRVKRLRGTMQLTLVGPYDTEQEARTAYGLILAALISGDETVDLRQEEQ